MLTGKVGPSLNAFNDVSSLVGDPPRKNDLGALPMECLLVIDSGFSHTTVTPVFKGRAIQQAIRRLDIGGKFLTNYLKEIVSLRQLNMVDETHLMNEVKEAVCYVSNDFKTDIERTWKGAVADRRKTEDNGGEIVVDYVLPDYTTHAKGFMRPHDASSSAKHTKLGGITGPGNVVEYVMTLGNERFAVPELVFNPGDIGMKQAGLPETVMQSLSGLPPGLWPAMLSNILVVGGNANIQGFVDRLYVPPRLGPDDPSLTWIS